MNWNGFETRQLTTEEKEILEYLRKTRSEKYALEAERKLTIGLYFDPADVAWFRRMQASLQPDPATGIASRWIDEQ